MKEIEKKEKLKENEKIQKEKEIQMMDKIQKDKEKTLEIKLNYKKITINQRLFSTKIKINNSLTFNF